MKLKSSHFALLLIALLYATLTEANGDYSLRVAYGKESDSDMGEILSFRKPTERKYNFDVLSLDVGYLLVPSLFEWPLDLYVKGGVALFGSEDLSKYSELTGMKDIYNGNIYEFTFYFKLYHNLDFLGNRVRIGLGEGGSYVNNYLPAEVIEETNEDHENAKYSKYLNYLDVSLDIDIGRLFGITSLKDTYLGYTLKHRSGIFGLINGVSGGSNYNTLSIEKNF